MADNLDYELLDFGRGRKLERFAHVLLDRPSPAADGSEQAAPELWAAAHARFLRTTADRGVWQLLKPRTPYPVPSTECSVLSTPYSVLSTLPADTWQLRAHDLTLELKRTSFGHVGLFPEQAENWQWVSRHVRAASQPVEVLNLFAYTGASTLAAAAAGAKVVHVDSARASVAWARRNAGLSGLAERPIRWIVEDARAFVQREIKRKRRYEGLILDPPGYGHGPRGQAWKLESHLAELLRDCGQLLSSNAAFVLLTCHSPGIGPSELRDLLTGGLPAPATVSAGELILTTRDGRQLPSGVFARWHR